MAQDIRLSFATQTGVTLLGSNLASASQSALTATVDFGDPAPLMFGFELRLDAQTGCVNMAHLEMAWSHDNTDFTDTDNLMLVTSVKCTASAIKKKIGAFPLLARYGKFRLNNQSGGTINSASTGLDLWKIAGDFA